MASITVLMPVYNVENYLNEAIDSILSQTFRDFEFLILNDGSTDSSEKIILSYKDSRIRYVKNEKNIGLVATLNRGIDLITTEYIVRMDSDDISVANRLEIQKQFMDTHPEIGVSSSALERFGAESAIWSLPILNDEIKSALLFGSSIAHAPCIIRTKILKDNNIHYRDLHPHMEDYDLWFRLKDITRFQNIPDVLYKYRVAEHNVTVTNASTKIERRKKIFKWILSTCGINPTEDELLLHIGFSDKNIRPTPLNIENYRKWLTKLLEANEKGAFFPSVSFKNQIDQKWNKLFFILPENGYNSVLKYILLSKKITSEQFFYLIKVSLKRLLNFKKHKL